MEETYYLNSYYSTILALSELLYKELFNQQIEWIEHKLTEYSLVFMKYECFDRHKNKFQAIDVKFERIERIIHFSLNSRDICTNISVY